MNVRRPVALVESAFGGHVISRPQNDRTEVNWFDKRVIGQATFFAGSGYELLEMREMFGQRVFPQWSLRQKREALEQPASNEDAPGFSGDFQQIKNRGRVVDKATASSSIIDVARRGASMNERAVAKCLRGDGGEPAIANGIVVSQR